MVKNPKFQIFQSEKNNEYYFRLTAKNGEIILASQGYTTKGACVNGIESVKTNSASDANFERKDGDGKFSFTVVAQNKQIVGRSESYTTKSARENGVESVKTNAPIAPIEDLAV